MANLELQHRVRLALSWRAEARRLEQQARERFESGTLEAGRFQHLLSKFTAQAALAQRALDAIRKGESENAARLGNHLRDCLGRKAAIGQQVKEGTIAHETAAAEIGRLDEEVKALRDLVGEFNRLLSVEDPAPLGGQIHAALEDYPIRLADANLAGDEPHGRRGWPRRWLVMASVIFALLGALAVGFILLQNRSIDMQVTWDASAPGEVTVECVNRGAVDFVVYVPAPEDGAPMQAGTHAMRVLVQGPDGAAAAVNTWGAWNIEGRATQYSNPQRLLAGKRAQFVLDLTRVPGHGPGQRRYTIECVGPTGNVVRRGEVTAMGG